ncbi:YlaH-like family protein [Salisediminibacterium beveridgei]|uniref:YlaH-like protein n=1 Tax=Salisediminibacterium beveridgei TaxID=632773 RepID=A0A1D7QWF9_9BACI|nr:YlaH-like family protein [Salisediminibacterium beveridgei]AOM83309.1 hypothetical protein BBEV_1948 [Salisediminibacterium beveridgei]
MIHLSSGAEPSPDFTPIAHWLGASDPANFEFVFWSMFIMITVLSILVFNLGFARKLPLFKNIVVYAVMLFGNMFITFFALTLPIIESLGIAAVILGVYKLQLNRHKRERGEGDQSEKENTQS